MTLMLGRPRGFTLLEMLVTLVLVSLVGAIVSQGLLQIARVERLLEGVQLQGMAASMRGEWVRAALAGLLPFEKSSANRFKGDTRSLDGISTATPQWPAAGLAPLSLRLRFDPREGRTELVQDVGLLAATVFSEPGLVVLLSWPGNTGRFRYLDRQNQWQDSWPAAGLVGSAASHSLPLAIALETGDSDRGVLLAAPRADELGLMPTRNAMEKL